jgi:phosphatidylglycerophosphate synthase
MSVAAVALAALGGWAVPLAALAVLLSGLLDGLDGALAVLSGRATRWGYVLDSVADRLADAAFLVSLYLLGAPAWVCVPAGTLTFLQEYARARAGAAGMSEIGVVTVWERPTRVIVTAAFLVVQAVPSGGVGPVTGVTAGAAAWLGLAVVGNLQLLVVIRRRLGPIGPGNGAPA